MNDSEQPTTSSASPPHRRRRSATDLHPLGQLRHFRPPLDDNIVESELSIQRRCAVTVDGRDLGFASDTMTRIVTAHQQVLDFQAENGVRLDNQLEEDLNLMDVDEVLNVMDDDNDDILSETDGHEIFEVIFKVLNFY